MTTRTLHTLRAALYAALDNTVFADAEALPALNAAYTASFQAYHKRIKTAPALSLCALCDEPTPVMDLAPLDTDHTYEMAVRQYSFERDDVLCPCCRDHFTSLYGHEADDVYHVFDRGVDFRD